jgi:hypothetical protein
MFAIAYTAFFALGLCYTLQIWAQRHTPPADAALILSLESVFAVISGWLILNEKLVSIQILGCVLIFVAVVLSQFKEWNSGTMDHDHLVEDDNFMTEESNLIEELDLSFHPLTQKLWRDFELLFGKHGACGGC